MNKTIAVAVFMPLSFIITKKFAMHGTNSVMTMRLTTVWILSSCPAFARAKNPAAPKSLLKKPMMKAAVASRGSPSMPVTTGLAAFSMNMRNPILSKTNNMNVPIRNSGTASHRNHSSLA